MRRALLLIGKVLLALVVGVIVLVLLAVGALQTQPGANLVADLARKQLVTLPGKISFENLRIRGLAGVDLSGVTVQTPDGETVVEVKEVQARLDLAPLLTKKIAVERLTIDGLVLTVVRDEKGLTLTRAFVADEPKPATKPEKEESSPLKLSIAALELKRSTLRYRDEGGKEQLSELELRAQADVVTVPLQVDGSVKLSGQLEGEPRLPLVAAIDARTPSPGKPSVSGTVELGDTVLRLARADLEPIAAAIDELRVTPVVVRRFAPWPIAVPVVLRGHGSLTGAELYVTAGSSKIDLEASGDFAAQTVDTLRLEAKEVNLAELLDGGMPSRLDATLNASAQGFSLDGRGAAELEATWAEPKGGQLAKLSAALKAPGDRTVEAGSIALSLPGAQVNAKGEAGLTSMEASASVRASDLALLRRTIIRYTGLDLPPLSGQGQISASGQGPYTQARLTAKGGFTNLQVAELQVGQVQLDVVVPNLQRPLDADGDVIAQRLTAGGMTFERIGAHLKTSGKLVDLRVNVRGLGDGAVHLIGTPDRDANGLALSQADVTLGREVWRLEDPTHVSWAGGHLKLELATLRAERAGKRQRLSVDLDLAGKALTAHARLDPLLLDRLPSAFVKPEWKLAGALSGTASVEGQLSKPKVLAALQLREGAAFGLERLEASLSADVGVTDARTAIGALDLKAGFGSVTGTARVPLDRSGPLKAAVQIDQLDLGALANAVGTNSPVQGRLGGVVALDGTLAHPIADVDLRGEDLALGGPCVLPALAEGYARSGPCQLSEGVVGARSLLAFERAHAKLVAADGGVKVAIDTTLGQGRLVAKASAPIDLGDAIQNPPTAATFDTMPLEANVKLDGLKLQELEAFAPTSALPLTGTASMELVASGPWKAPVGTAELELDGVAVSRWSKIDAKAQGTVGAEGLHLALKSFYNTHPWVDLAAELSGSMLTIADERTWGARQLKAFLTLTDTPLQVLGAPPSLSGAARAEVRVEGTLASPVTTAMVGARGLAMAQAKLGEVTAQLTSRSGAPTAVAVEVKSPGDAPALRAQGTVGLTLAPALAKTGVPETTPIALSATAQQLELGFLSGIHPVLRRIGGRLDGHLQVEGPLKAPAIEGDASWANGELVIAGYGNYKNIDIKLSGNGQQLRLDTFKARSGSGDVWLEAKADLQPSKSWTFSAKGKSSRFPIVVQDQLMASVSMETTLEGAASSSLINITRVSLPDVEVRLPDVARKNLQDLQRPGDIVVLKAGRRPKNRPPPLLERPPEEEKVDEEKPPPEPASSPMQVVAIIDAPRNIWVRSTEVNIELGLSEGFRVEYAQEPGLSGTVFVRRGTVSAIGRRFTVSNESTVTFARVITQPRLDVKAIYENEREQVSVTAAVTGRGTNFRVKLTSDPPMSESEMFILLATGRRQLRRGTGASMSGAQAASLIGSLVASEMQKVFGDKVPFDVLTLDVGQDFSQTTFEAGKYITDWLYLGTRGDLGADWARGENTVEGRAEFILNKNTTLEVAGGNAAAGADLFWGREF